MNAANLKLVTATAVITAADAYLHAVVITAGADAATATIKAGGASGTTILVLNAAIGVTVSSGYLGDVVCPSGIHVTITGTTPSVSVSYS